MRSPASKWRARVLESGKSARTEDLRGADDDLKLMVSMMTVWGDGEACVSIRRILREVDE